MAKLGVKPKRAEIIWTTEFAYGVGLLATDGCLYNDGYHLSFVSKDKEQIQNILRIFTISAVPKLVHTEYGGSEKTYYKVQWGDVTLHSFLTAIGISSHKSKSIGKIAIPEEFFFDFLRGHFDGDGSFHSYYDKRWPNSYMFYLSFVSASEVHILWLREQLYQRLGVRGHISHAKNSSVFQLRYAKKESSKVFAKMYPNPTSMCLSRKRLKVLAALGIVGLSLPRGATAW